MSGTARAAAQASRQASQPRTSQATPLARKNRKPSCRTFVATDLQLERWVPGGSAALPAVMSVILVVP